MLIKKILLTEDAKPNYLFLLIVLFIIIAYPVLTLVFGNPDWVFHSCFSIVILTSILYTFNTHRKLTFGLAIGIFALLTYWLEVFIDNEISKTLNLVSNIIFFFFLLLQVTFETIGEKNVTVNTLYAVSVGYLLLGFMGFWLLTIVDILMPGSFAGNFSEYRSYDLIYFSFVTLTSVGFGDIQSITPQGKAICLLIGVIGQLYVSFAIAMIVGKYLNQKYN